MELAVGLKRRGVDYVQFDAGQFGHTMTWWAPQTRFFSSNERIAIAGVPLETSDGTKCTREQYLTYLRGVVRQFALEVRTYEPVTDLERTGAGEFVLTTKPQGGTERQTRARRVVLATGGTARARRLGIAGEDLPQVTHYFQEPHLYSGRRLMVVGGRNSAAEAALRCHHAGAKVTLSYRGEGLARSGGGIKYWLLPELQGLIDAGRIEGLFGTTPVEIGPGRVRLRHADGGERDHPADFVLLMTGYEADMTLFGRAGARLSAGSGAPVFDVATMETSVPGLYVAGTAVAGTQSRYEVFIENAHVHVERIVAALTGEGKARAAPTFAMPES